MQQTILETNVMHAADRLKDVKDVYVHNPFATSACYHCPLGEIQVGYDV